MHINITILNAFIILSYIYVFDHKLTFLDSTKYDINVHMFRQKQKSGKFNRQPNKQQSKTEKLTGPTSKGSLIKDYIVFISC